MNIQIGEMFQYHDLETPVIAFVTDIKNNMIYYNVFNHPNQKYDGAKWTVRVSDFKSMYPYKLA